MLRVTKSCPAYNIEFEKAKYETEKQMLIKYETFFNYVSNHTGTEIKHLSDLESIFNSLNIQVIYYSSLNYIIVSWYKTYITIF